MDLPVGRDLPPHALVYPPFRVFVVPFADAADLGKLDFALLSQNSALDLAKLAADLPI